MVSANDSCRLKLCASDMLATLTHLSPKAKAFITCFDTIQFLKLSPDSSGDSFSDRLGHSEAAAGLYRYYSDARHRWNRLRWMRTTFWRGVQARGWL